MTFAWSQDYFFDRLIQYDQNGENKIQLYFSTTNPAYFLYLNATPTGASADLYDKVTMKIHHFEVVPLQENNGSIYSFRFASTDKLLEVKKPKNLSYEFKTKRDDEYYRFADLNIFEDNASKPMITADLTMRYTHQSQFEAFNLCCLLGFDYFEILKPDDNFVVVKATVIDQIGKKHEYRLISDQVVQFKLVVPEIKKK